MNYELSSTEGFFRSIIQRYNHKKYWKYRAVIINPKIGTKVGKVLRLFYIKRADAFNNASLGTHINFGAVFEGIPRFPHGLNGIIISHNAIIGKECVIFHQVTVGEGRGGAPIIGDNVILGAGCKIIGNIRIGNNVKIGAGCVVMQDIPDDAIVATNEPKIIIRDGRKRNE